MKNGQILCCMKVKKVSYEKEVPYYFIMHQGIFYYMSEHIWIMLHILQKVYVKYSRKKFCKIFHENRYKRLGENIIYKSCYGDNKRGHLCFKMN